MKKIILLFFSLAFFSLANAQSQFTLLGNAVNQGGTPATVYRLTTATDGQAGLITNQYVVNLATTFSLTFDLSFGTQSGGADGIAFAISSACSPTLGGGEGLGADPVTMNPGIIVEFDTHENGSLNDDPGSGQEDHIGVYKIDNAADRISTTAARLTAGTAPWQPGSSFSNANAYHTVIITWTYNNAASQTLQVSFDGTVRQTHTGDYLSGLFGNVNLQFWSVSGSTGASNNEHRVRYIEPNQSSTTTCGAGAHQFVAPSRGSSYTWSPNTFTGDGNNNDTISATPLTTTTYTCTYTNFCSESRSVYFVATVQNPLPEGTISGTTTVCKNAASPDITFTGTTGTQPFTFSYTINGGATQTASTSGGSSTVTVAVPTTTAGSYTYSLTAITDASGSGCQNNSPGGGSSSATVTVNPDATLSLTSATGTDTQNVCLNTPIIDIEYTGNSVVTGFTSAGLPPGVSGNFGGGVYTISGTPTVNGIYTYTVTTTGLCVQTDTVGIIRVGFNLASANNTQSVCKNSAIADIVYNFPGGDVPPPVVSGLPAGVSGIVSNPGEFTISGTPSVEGTFNYTVATDGSCNPQSSLSGTLTIGVGLTTAGTDTQSICKNSPITDIVYNIVGGDVPSPTIIGLPDGVTGSISSPGVFTISGTPTVEGTFRYIVTTNGSCNPQSSVSGMLTIGVGLVTPGTDTQTVCKNDPIVDIVYDIAGGNAPVATTDAGLPAGVTGSFNAGTQQYTISGTPAVEGIFNYTVTAQGSCGSASNFYGVITSGGGVVVPGTDTQTVCKNDPIVDIVYDIAGGNAPVATTDAGLPAGVTGSFNAGTQQYTISGTPAVEGIFNYTVTAQGSCGSASNFYGVITVGIGLVTPGTDTQTVCKNSPITDIVYNFVGGGVPAIVGLPSGLTSSVTSVGVFTISGTPAVEGTFRYTVTTNGSCNPQSNLSGMLTVGIGLVTPGTDTQSVCKNAPITSIVYNFVGGGTPVISGSFPGGVVGTVTSPGVYTISGTPSVEGTFRYTITTTGTCSPQSNLSGMLTVGVGLVTPGTDTQTVCQGTPIVNIAYNFVGGGTPVVTGLPAGVTGSVTSPGVFTISGAPAVAGVFDYTITTTGTCNPQSALYGQITADNATATLSLTSGLGTDYQRICSDSSLVNIVYIIGGTGTGAVVSTLPSGVTGIYTAGVFIISGTPNVPDGTYTYTVTPTGGSCPAAAATFTITVMHPIAAFTSDDDGGKPPLPINFTNTSQNADTYSWTFGDGNISSTTDASNTYTTIGIYPVQLIASNNSQCPDTATSEITVYQFVITNVFTPNGDNINDVFTINTTGINDLSAEIYNRWGLKMYEWDLTRGGWDGINMINGAQCTAGTYFYIVKAKDMDGKEYNETGFITLIR